MRACPIVFVVMFLFACAGREAARLQSYQSRSDKGYVYMLSHTASLTGQRRGEKLQAPIAREDFAQYGSCFYQVVSENKLRLHRRDDLQRALSEAQLVSSNYIPLDTLWQQFHKDRALQELYTSSRHWIFPLVGGAGVISTIVLVDSLLHRGNGVIVANASKYVVKSFSEGDRSLRRQTWEALHAIAESEHLSDELVRKTVARGKHNPLHRINRSLMDGKPARSFAKLFSKTCASKVRAAVCLVGYLAAFNSMFVVGIPVGSDRLGGLLARWHNRDREDSALSDLLGDHHSLTNTHLSSEKTMTALTKIAQLAPSATPVCPVRPAVD